ncbi:MAG: hypothetical protein WAW13_00725 [Minisyncoccia bacterium]
METLVLDGKSYVKASKAARDLGYATDYVGQLCRSGKVSAHLIGRTWYVNADELGTHRVEKKRMSRIKAREQAHKSIEEHRVKISTTSNTYKNIDIQYENDQEDLIPQTKKLLIQTPELKHYIEKEKADTRPTYVNKGEKVLMRGSVSVVDVTDGVIDDETTVLTPTAIRKEPIKQEQKSKEVRRITAEEDLNETQNAEQHVDLKQISVADEGQIEEVAVEQEAYVQSKSIQEESISEVTQTQSSVLPYIIIIFFVLCLSALSVPLSLKMQYRNEDPSKITSSYSFSLDKTMELLRLRI